MICLLSTCWRTEENTRLHAIFSDYGAQHNRAPRTLSSDWNGLATRVEHEAMQQAAEPTSTRRRCEWVQQIVVVVARASWSWGVVRGEHEMGWAWGLLLPVAVASRERIRQLWFLLLLATFYLAFCCCCSPPNELHIFFLTFGLFITFVCVFSVCACARVCVCWRAAQWGVAAETHHGWTERSTRVELKAPPVGNLLSILHWVRGICEFMNETYFSHLLWVSVSVSECVWASLQCLCVCVCVGSAC